MSSGIGNTSSRFKIGRLKQHIRISISQDCKFACQLGATSIDKIGEVWLSDEIGGGEV